MDIDDPLIGAYGILLVGSQVTYFGMKFNGRASATPSGAVLNFKSNVGSQSLTFGAPGQT